MRQEAFAAAGAFRAVFGAALLFFGAFYALLVPLPLYLAGIGLPSWQVGVILGAFGVASLVGRPLAGVASDRWGHRRVMLVGVASLAAGAAGVSFTVQPAVLFGLRILQALGYVAFTTAATALVADLSPAARRGAALALFGAAANVAMTLTPAAGGAPAASSGPFRFPPGLAPLMLAAGLFGVGFGAFLQFLPLLTRSRGLGPAGAAYTIYGVGIILSRVTTGRWLDRVERSRILTPVFLLLAAGMAGFALAGSRTALLASAALTAVASGILHPGLIGMHVDRVAAGERARAGAACYLGFDLGIGAGAWLLAPAFQWFGLAGLYGAAAAVVALGAPLMARARRAMAAPAAG